MSARHLQSARGRVLKAQQQYKKTFQNMNVEHPYGMISTKVKPKSHKRKRNKSKRNKKFRKKLERARLSMKQNSPGVPPNTCPYIDLVITMVQDMSEAYDDLRTKGNHNPVVECIEERAKDMLEYIRTNNETLRDNSLYWYNSYKTILNS